MRINPVPIRPYEEYTQYALDLAAANPDFEKNLSELHGARREGTSTLFALAMLIQAIDNPRTPVGMRDYTPVRSHQNQMECWPDRYHRFKYMARAIQSFISGHPELQHIYKKFHFNLRADTLTFIP